MQPAHDGVRSCVAFDCLFTCTAMMIYFHVFCHMQQCQHKKLQVRLKIPYYWQFSVPSVYYNKTVPLLLHKAKLAKGMSYVK